MIQAQIGSKVAVGMSPRLTFCPAIVGFYDRLNSIVSGHNKKELNPMQTGKSSKRYKVRPLGNYGREYILGAAAYRVYRICGFGSIFLTALIPVYVFLKSFVDGIFPSLNLFMVGTIIFAALLIVGAAFCLTKSLLPEDVVKQESDERRKDIGLQTFKIFRSLQSKMTLISTSFFLILCSDALIWASLHSQPINPNIWALWGISLFGVLYCLLSP